MALDLRDDTYYKNEMIAQFMGYKEDDGDYLMSSYLPQFRGSDHGEWCTSVDIEDEYEMMKYWQLSPGNMKYHQSWDWIMTVIDKIESSRDCIFTITKKSLYPKGGYDCSIAYTKEGVFFKNNHISKLESVFLTVCDFVEWSNKK